MKLNSLWVEKYNPTTTKNIIGNKENIRILKNWLNNFNKNDTKKNDTKKNAILITGQPGLGKSTLAKLASLECGYEPIEYNASDIRSKKSIQETIYYTIHSRHVSNNLNKLDNRLAIIMDEVDGMSSGDRGGIKELVDLIANKLNTPIICICNNRYAKGMKDLVKECVLIKFEFPLYDDLFAFGAKIVTNEKINITKKALEKVILFSDYDIRYLIGLLYEIHTLGYKIDSTNIKDVLDIFSKKDKESDLFITVSKLLSISGFSIDQTLKMYNLDRTIVPLTIYENYQNYIFEKDSKDTLDTLINIINSMISGDQIEKEIYTYQFWDLQQIHGVMTTSAVNYYITKNKNKIIDTATTQRKNNKMIIYSLAMGRTSTHNAKKIAHFTLKNKLPWIDIYPSYCLDFIKKYLLDTFIEKNNSNFNKCIKIMKYYNLNIHDLDLLSKLMEFNENYQKQFTTKVKTQIKKQF